jgi:LPS sulfotransferase NodH
MLPTDRPAIRNSVTAIQRTLAMGPMSGAPFTDRAFLFVAMVPRSGSSYLGSLIGANGYHMHKETFRLSPRAFDQFVAEHGCATYEDYVRAKIAHSTVNGLFGAKVGWVHFAPLYASGAYAHYFGQAKFVYMTRQDMVAQAISSYIARQVGYRHSYQVDDPARLEEDVPFDFDEISRLIAQFRDIQSDWEWFFEKEGVTPLRLTYEALTADPAAALHAIGGLVDRPMGDSPVVETDIRSVSSGRNARLHARYWEELRARGLTSA